MDQLAFSFELTDEERQILTLLRKGRANAITVRELSEETGLNEKIIRQTVRDLIMDRWILIGSAVHHPAGYFIPETADEAIAATKSIRHRGIMILMRAARLQRASLELVFNQARLELEEVSK